MRKFTTIASALMLAGIGFTANAQAPGLTGQLTADSPVTVNGGYNVSVSYLTLNYGEAVTFTQDAPAVTIKCNGEEKTLPASQITIKEEFNDALMAEVPCLVNFDLMGFTVAEDWSAINFGSYELIIPAGLIETAEGETNDAQTISFTEMKGMDEYDGAECVPAQSKDDFDNEGNLIPAPEYSYTEATAFTITWPGYTMSFTGVDLYPTANKAGGVPEFPTYPEVRAIGSNGLTSFNLTDYVTLADNKLSFDLSTFAPGTYDIEIPVGYIFLTDEEKYINKAITLTYTIVGLDEPTVLSAPQGAAQFAANLQLTWDYQEVTPVEGVKGQIFQGITEVASFTGADFNFSTQQAPSDEPGTPETFADEKSGNVVTLYVGDYLLNAEPGYYRIVIPAGMFVNAEGYESPAMECSFDLIAGFFGEQAEFEYADGVICVTWPNVEVAQFNFEESFIITGENLENRIDLAPGEDGFGFIFDDEDMYIVGFKIFVDELNLADGSYTLIIPEGSVLMNEDMTPCQESSFNFEVGVSAPQAVVVAPAPGAEFISSMQVVWGDFETITLAEGVTAVQASLQLPDEAANAILLTGRLAWADPVGFEDPGMPFDGEDNGDGDDDDAMNSVLFQFPESYFDYGFYTLTIPAGQLLANGVALGETVVKYQITTVAPSVTLPEATMSNGEYMDPLTADNGFTLTWGYENITLNEGTATITNGINTYTMKAELVREIQDGIGGNVSPADDDDENGEVGDGTPETGEPGEEVYNAVLLTVDDADFEGFEPGLWEISIPAGLVTGPEDAVNEAQSFSIYVLDQVTEAPEIYPAVENFNAEPVKVDALNTIDISWADYYMVSLADAKIYLKDEDGNEIDLVDAGAVEVDEMSGSLYLYVGEFTKAGGIYEVLVAPNSILLTDDNAIFYLSNEIVVTYDVTPASEPGQTTIGGLIGGPVDNVITITYVCDWIERGPAQYDGEAAVLVDADGVVTELSFGAKGYNPVYVDSDDVTLVIDLNMVNLAAGDYNLVLPEGYLNVVDAEYNDHNSAAVGYSFTLDTPTGINIINAEGQYNIFNLNGVNVGNSVKNLNNGIYIINGKKVVIRK